MASPLLATNLHHSIAYGQFYVSGQPKIAGGDPGPQLVGLDDANQSGRRVGVAEGLVVVVAPVQFHWDAEFRVEVWDDEPALTEDRGDHIVDVDLDAPHGGLYFWELPHPDAARQCEVPAGRYRLRLSGLAFDAGAAFGQEEGGPDSYVLRLWPRREDREPELRRAWFEWTDAHSTT